MKVLVLGASTNPQRYSNIAINMLSDYGHEVFCIGRDKGIVRGVPIIQEKKDIHNLHTVTLYLNPHNQEDYLDYIVNLNPKRVIFNPGTDNPKLKEKLKSAGIHYESACTLVMLRSGIFGPVSQY